jgi:hypothetical protein
MPLVWLPVDATWEGATVPGAFPFAAGGLAGTGKVLVLADHSVFINDMLLQPDNDNFFFACNCIDWLTDSRKRNRVFFLEEGRVVTDFNVVLKEPPGFVMPSEGVLIDKGNEFLAGLDRADFFNNFIRERVGDDQLLRNRALRLALLVLTGVLLVLGMRRLILARHRHDRHEPLLAPCLAAPGVGGSLIDRRTEEVLRQNNCLEMAQQQARQCFLALRPAEAPGAVAAAWEWRASAPPRIQVTGSWSRRRTLSRQVFHLWRVACGQPGERITPKELQELEKEISTVRAALGDGSLKLG